MRKTTLALLAIASAGHGLTTPAAAQFATENLSIHGYMTQAYATASDLPIHGIPNDGTSDYRTAALLLRYGLSDNDNFVVQAKNRRMGNSVLTAAEDDVQLQWAFYQRRIGNASVRVGKIPLELGLYNETRNVGTLLPFYRAPASFYMEGVETLNGVNLRYSLPLGAWEVEAIGSGGEFDIHLPTHVPNTGTQILRTLSADWNYTVGMMVSTPLPGLRAGGTFQKFKSNSLTSPSEKATASVLVGSLDGSFDKFFVRAEARSLDWETVDVLSYYAQAGVKPHPRLSLNTQYEQSRNEAKTPVGVMKQTTVRDAAVGAGFSISPSVVFKLEGHRVSGYSFDTYVVPTGPKAEGDYMITSLSVSF